MSKRLAVTSLPKDVLQELRQRLAESNFSMYEAHAEWLTSQGYPISKSSIHRYATEHASSVMSSQSAKEGLSAAEARLCCLEVAATLEPAASPADLIKRAEELLKWVYTV